MKLTGLFKGILLALLFIQLTACVGPAETPEERIRDFVQSAEVAAESRSLDFFKDALSDAYTDNHGLTKKELLRMLAGYFFRNQSIHIVSKMIDITVVDESHAEVAVFVALAGSPEAGLEQIMQLRGDSYRLDLVLRLDDEIQIASASWERSTPAEAFNQ